MSLIKKVFIIIFVIAGGLLFIRFIFGGPEDSWICKDNQWIKHGNPSYPKPTVNCRNKSN